MNIRMTYEPSEEDLQEDVRREADWEGFPKFRLMKSDTTDPLDAAALPPRMKYVVVRAAMILGGKDAILARDIAKGCGMQVVLPILEDASRIVEAAIGKFVAASDYSYVEIRVRAPWPMVEGPFLTLSESLSYEPPASKASLPGLFAAAAIWAVHQARRCATNLLDPEPLDVLRYTAEAALFLAEAEYWDGWAARSQTTATIGRDAYKDERDTLKAVVHEKYWITWSPDQCSMDELAEVIAIATSEKFKTVRGWLTEFNGFRRRSETWCPKKK